MRLLYRQSDGRIFYAVRDVAWPLFTHSTNIPLDVLYIDETPENAAAIADVVAHLSSELRNQAGQVKYYISGGTLYARENWRPVPPRFLRP